MRKTLKQFALLPLFCGLLITVACNKDDDKKIPSGWFNGRITAVVENGNNYNSLIGKVAVIAEFRTDKKDEWGYYEWDSEIIASNNWSNGGFTLTLPAMLDDKFLWDLSDDFPTSLTLSDRNVKVSNAIWFRPYNSDGDCRVGWLDYGKEDENSYVVAFFVYADRDVIITGSHDDYCCEECGTWFEVWNVSLKRGWNKIYATEKEVQGGWRAEYSTKAVSGLKWYFEEMIDWQYYCENQPPIGDGQSITFTANVHNSHELGFIRRVRAVETMDLQQTIASANFTATGNTNFTLTLDQSPNPWHLFSVTEFFEGSTASNPNARIAYVDIEGFTSVNGVFDYEDRAGDFYLYREYATGSVHVHMEALLFYADRDVVVHGTIDREWQDIYDLNLKKGWNWVYITSEWNAATEFGTYLYSTTSLSDLQWFFGGVIPDGAPSSDRFASPARKRMQERGINSLSNRGTKNVQQRSSQSALRPAPTSELNRNTRSVLNRGTALSRCGK
jgi:hypothetical protein